MNYKLLTLPIDFKVFYRRSTAMSQENLFINKQKQQFSHAFKKSKRVHTVILLLFWSLPFITQAQEKINPGDFRDGNKITSRT